MRKNKRAEHLRTTDDWMAEWQRIHEGSWLARVWFYRRAFLLAPWRAMRGLPSSLLAFWQRGRRGWAISDTWYGDVYLARLISEMCAYLKEHTYTTPYPFYQDEEHGHEQYAAYLGEMAAAFGDYVTYMDGSHEDFGLDIGNARYHAILARMRPLLDHWSSLND